MFGDLLSGSLGFWDALSDDEKTTQKSRNATSSSASGGSKRGTQFCSFWLGTCPRMHDCKIPSPKQVRSCELNFDRNSLLECNNTQLFGKVNVYKFRRCKKLSSNYYNSATHLCHVLYPYVHHLEIKAVMWMSDLEKDSYFRRLFAVEPKESPLFSFSAKNTKTQRVLHLKERKNELLPVNYKFASNSRETRCNMQPEEKYTEDLFHFWVNSPQVKQKHRCRWSPPHLPTILTWRQTHSLQNLWIYVFANNLQLFCFGSGRKLRGNISCRNLAKTGMASQLNQPSFSVENETQSKRGIRRTEILGLNFDADQAAAL